MAELLEHRWCGSDPVHELEELASACMNGIGNANGDVDIRMGVQGDQALLGDGGENGETVGCITV